MKALPNMHETVISNWKRGELRNIRNSIRYFPKIKGYRWYECKTCGLKTKFNIPDNLDNPNEQIGDVIINNKKSPKKIFCPRCMINFKGTRIPVNPNSISKISGDIAVKDVSNNIGYLEQASEILEYDDLNVPGPNENIFCVSMNCKEGIPIYREFIDLFNS